MESQTYGFELKNGSAILGKCPIQDIHYLMDYIKRNEFIVLEATAKWENKISGLSLKSEITVIRCSDISTISL